MSDLTENIAKAREHGYDDQQIIGFLSQKTDLAPKIKKAQDSGYEPGAIVDYLKAAAPSHRYTPAEVKERFANFAPAQGSTDTSNWAVAKDALKGAGKFLLDPMGISHGSGLQVTGTDEKGQPMYGVGGPSTGPLALRGPAEEFGATMASSPMLAEGGLAAGKAVAGVGRTLSDVIRDPSVLRRTLKAALPHGKEFVEAGDDVARAMAESKSRALAAEHRAGPQPVPPWRDNPTPVVEPPSEIRPISYPWLPSGRVPGPNLATAKPPIIGNPPWRWMPNPEVATPPAVEPIQGTLPSGRQPGPMPQVPRLAPPPGIAVQHTAYEAPAAVEPITAPLPSGRKPGGIQNQVPMPRTSARTLLKKAQVPFTPAEDAMVNDILAGVEREPAAQVKPTTAPTLAPPGKVPFTELETNASHQKINQSIHNALEQMGVEREPRKTMIQEMMDKKFGAGKTLAFTEKGLKGRTPLTSAEKFDLLREIHKMDAPK